MSQLLHCDNDAKAIAIPWVLSENSRAKKKGCARMKKSILFYIIISKTLPQRNLIG